MKSLTPNDSPSTRLHDIQIETDSERERCSGRQEDGNRDREEGGMHPGP